MMRKLLTTLLITLSITGCEYGDPNYHSPMSDAEFQQLLIDIHDDAFNQEIPELTYNDVTKYYELSASTNSLTLASIGEHSTSITWQSVNPAIITDDGIVLTHPTGSTISLIAIVEKHGLRGSKTFTIIFL